MNIPEAVLFHRRMNKARTFGDDIVFGREISQAKILSERLIIRTHSRRRHLVDHCSVDTSTLLYSYLQNCTADSVRKITKCSFSMLTFLPKTVLHRFFVNKQKILCVIRIRLDFSIFCHLRFWLITRNIRVIIFSITIVFILLS